MIINNLHIIKISFIYIETNAVFIINPYTVLSFSIATELFQMISRRYS